MMEPDRVRELIESALPDCTAVVIDNAGDKSHFMAEVTSPAFEGLSLIKQHKLVYGALEGLVGGDIHALALKTYTPARWTTRGN